LTKFQNLKNFKKFQSFKNFKKIQNFHKTCSHHVHLCWSLLSQKNQTLMNDWGNSINMSLRQYSDLQCKILAKDAWFYWSLSFWGDHSTMSLMFFGIITYDCVFGIASLLSPRPWLLTPASPRSIVSVSGTTNLLFPHTQSISIYYCFVRQIFKLIICFFYVWNVFFPTFDHNCFPYIYDVTF
jgi:hypothetical protein